MPIKCQQKTTPRVELAQDLLGRTDFGGVDASTGRTASIRVPTGCIWLVHRLILYIQDGGTWAANKFGGTTALPNGLNFRIYSEKLNESMGNILPKPIKTCGDLGRYAFTLDFQKMGGTQKFLSAQLVPTKFSAGVWLIAEDYWRKRLDFVMQDNFSALDGLSLAAQITMHTSMPNGATMIYHR